MKNKKDQIEEIKEDKKEDKKEDIKEDIKEESESEIKEELKDKINDINIKETTKSNVIIKKPNITEEEYQKMKQKRNAMVKNSKYRPMTLLFGRQAKLAIQNNQNNNISSPTNPNINNNIQINNYTTYLTSVESIAEEKYQKDGQTLIMESPNYSMKQLNYKYKINFLNKIMIIYIRKINELEDIFNFTNNYLSFVIQIFMKLSKPYIFSLSEIFKNNIYPNLKYFKEISFIFTEFSEKISNVLNKPLEDKINNVVISKANTKLSNNMTYMDCNLNDSVKKINNIYANAFKSASKNIQNLIFKNQLYAKIDTIEIKLTDNYNKMVVLINKLIHRQNKFSEKYKKNFLPFFAGIKEKLNDPSLFRYLTSGKDFIFIEKEIIFYTNKIYSKISNFMINMEFLFKESQTIFYDYLELLNHIILLYYKDNSSILNITSLLPNKSIINFDNLLKMKDIRKGIEEKYTFNNIIENNNNEKLFNEINHYLLNYRDLLHQYNYVKSEDIEEVINFNLINYNSSERFIQFLMKLIPSKFPFRFKDIIELKMNIKRNSGIIKGWKNALLVITYQGHIYIFDKDGETGAIGSRKEIINSIIDDDKIKNKNEENENEDLYEAIKNNKLITNYWRSNFGAVKLLSKDNKKLLQFYEDYLGYRQYRPTEIDVINDDNYNLLINTLSNNKII